MDKRELDRMTPIALRDLAADCLARSLSTRLAEAPSAATSYALQAIACLLLAQHAPLVGEPTSLERRL